jgi:hypothetical protein
MEKKLAKKKLYTFESFIGQMRNFKTETERKSVWK